MPGFVLAQALGEYTAISSLGESIMSAKSVIESSLGRGSAAYLLVGGAAAIALFLFVRR